MMNLNFKYPRLKLIYICISGSLLLASCGGTGKSDAGDDDKTVNAQTPVTVTTVGDSTMIEYTSLNAISAFQQRNYVKANATGYIQKVFVQPGQDVEKGQVLFTIKTKEAQSIGNAVNILDTTFKFSGETRIRAAEHGYISQLLHQQGDYVQDGEQLAVIADKSSFAFIM